MGVRKRAKCTKHVKDFGVLVYLGLKKYYEQNLVFTIDGYIYNCHLFCTITEDSVKQVVNNLFIGMKASNGAMIAAAFADSAVLQTISRDKPSENWCQK